MQGQRIITLSFLWPKLPNLTVITVLNYAMNALSHIRVRSRLTHETNLKYKGTYVFKQCKRSLQTVLCLLSEVPAYRQVYDGPNSLESLHEGWQMNLYAQRILYPLPPIIQRRLLMHQKQKRIGQKQLYLEYALYAATYFDSYWIIIRQSYRTFTKVQCKYLKNCCVLKVFYQCLNRILTYLQCHWQPLLLSCLGPWKGHIVSVSQSVSSSDCYKIILSWICTFIHSFIHFFIFHRSLHRYNQGCGNSQ
jgi:hypothetical protein